MLKIHSYAHSYRTRQTSKGEVIDVIFRVIDEGGVERQKTLSGFATKRLADKAYAEFVSKYCTIREKDEPFKRSYIKFSDAASKYLTYSRASTTAETALKRIRFFEQHYLPCFANKNIETIRSSDIYQWFDTVISKDKLQGTGNYAPRTLKSIWGQLHTFFAWCSNRFNTRNPMSNLKMPKTKPIEKNMLFWELSEFQCFISKVDNIYWKTFFMFQFYTGCRIGETLALSESDYSKGMIKIVKSLSKKNLKGERYEIKTTKNCKNRTIPLPDILKNQLAEYLEWKRQNDLPTKFLFCGKDGDYLPHTTIRRMFDIYTQKSGVSRIKIHDLRHSYVSLLIHKGANLAVIAGLIGDTFEQVTNTYGHMYESDKLNAVKLLDE